MLIVFDLDFTIWNCGNTFIDATQPPFIIKENNVYDSHGRKFELYPDSEEILQSLKSQDVKIAAASRTYEPSWAQQVLKMYNVDKYFDYKQIFPSSKVQHFNKIKTQSNLAFSEMYFFDDEYRNILEVGKLGVNCQLVDDGINIEMVEKLTGLKI